MLVVVTLIWGLSFTWTKNWQLASAGCPGGPLLAALTLIGLRMALALLILAAWQPRLVRAPTRHQHAAGALLGCTFFVGFTLQVWGMAWTTPARSAFFTSLCSAWVPLLLWAGAGVAVRRPTLLGLLLGLAGTAVLGLEYDSGWVPGWGEVLTILASLLFAIQMILLDRLGRVGDSAHLTAAFFATTGLLAGQAGLILAAAGPGLAAWGDWTVAMLHNPLVLRDLTLLTLFPTVLAFHWMNTYQPRIPASRAALIYLLEPVFSAAYSVWAGQDAVTQRLLLGGALILAGNLLVELPRWFRSPGSPVLDG
jgi:drug/metabolite transporter (DMT)-like permease